jgi:hypothetical protein
MNVIIEINGVKHELRSESFFGDLTCKTCSLKTQCDKEKEREELPSTQPIHTICSIRRLGFYKIQ